MHCSLSCLRWLPNLFSFSSLAEHRRAESHAHLLPACIHQRSSFLSWNHTASHGAFHLVPGTWSVLLTEDSAHSEQLKVFMGCVTGIMSAQTGQKHHPEYGMTGLRMLCNETTRNLLSFMARKKLGYEKWSNFLYSAVGFWCQHQFMSCYKTLPLCTRHWDVLLSGNAVLKRKMGELCKETNHTCQNL